MSSLSLLLLCLFQSGVDCELTGWSDWSTECSAACGIGEKVRTREVIKQPVGGGRPCGELRDTAECFVTPCGKKKKDNNTKKSTKNLIKSTGAKSKEIGRRFTSRLFK